MKHRKKLVIFSLFVIGSVFLTSCAEIEETAISSPAYEIEMNKTSIMAININVDAAKWEGMLESGSDEEYIPADITINGETVKNVGIRLKGNSSRSSISRDTDLQRYSFKLNHYRLEAVVVQDVG